MLTSQKLKFVISSLIDQIWIKKNTNNFKKFDFLIFEIFLG